jgi:hypothetical protein
VKREEWERAPRVGGGHPEDEAHKGVSECQGTAGEYKGGGKWASKVPFPKCLLTLLDVGSALPARKGFPMFKLQDSLLHSHLTATELT